MIQIFKIITDPPILTVDCTFTSVLTVKGTDAIRCGYYFSYSLEERKSGIIYEFKYNKLYDELYRTKHKFKVINDKLIIFPISKPELIEDDCWFESLNSIIKFTNIKAAQKSCVRPIIKTLYGE